MSPPMSIVTCYLSTYLCYQRHNTTHMFTNESHLSVFNVSCCNLSSLKRNVQGTKCPKFVFRLVLLRLPKPRFLCKTERNRNRGFRRPNSRFGFKWSALRYARLFCMNYRSIHHLPLENDRCRHRRRNGLFRTSLQSLAKTPEATAARSTGRGVSIGQPHRR